MRRVPLLAPWPFNLVWTTHLCLPHEHAKPGVEPSPTFSHKSIWPRGLLFSGFGMGLGWILFQVQQGNPNHHTRQKLQTCQHLMLNQALCFEKISPLWGMNHKFTHGKFYISNWKFAILLTCTTTLVLLNRAFKFFLIIWVQLLGPFLLFTITLVSPITFSFP